MLKKWIPILALNLVFATPFEWRAELDQNKAPLHTNHEAYLLIEFETTEDQLPKQNQRNALNLNLVLDRSGSMSDAGKMEFAKKAALKAVDALNKEDHLGIVEYDDIITKLWPTAPVVHKKAIRKKINALQPRNGTNLAGGLQEGINEVNTMRRLEKLNRVLLMSDGLANEGITDPAAIAQISKRAKQKGITVSTLGLGTSYNEDLMQDIAEKGGGNYYYVESANQLPAIFEKELQSLFATVCKNLTIQFERNPALSAPTVIGYPSEKIKNTTKISMENLYAPDTRSLLIKVPIHLRAEGKFWLGDVIVIGTNALTNEPFETRKSVYVYGESNQELIKTSINKTVKSDAILMETEEEEKQILKDYEAGNIEAARKKNQDIVKRLQSKNLNLGDRKIAKKLEALNIEEQEMSVSFATGGFESQSFLKSKKSKIFYGKRGKKTSYIMELGDRGDKVKALQEKLKGLGFYQGPLDSDFSKELQKSLVEFQKSKGLTPDGIAGPKVMKSLGIY